MQKNTIWEIAADDRWEDQKNGRNRERRRTPRPRPNAETTATSFSPSSLHNLFQILSRNASKSRLARSSNPIESSKGSWDISLIFRFLRPLAGLFKLAKSLAFVLDVRDDKEELRLRGSVPSNLADSDSLGDKFSCDMISDTNVGMGLWNIV